GRADAAAARSQHHQPVARRYELKALAAHFLARLEPDIARRAITAAVAATRRVLDTVEGRQDVPRPADAALDLDHLAESAARAPRAAAIRAQLLLPEDQRRLARGALDRRAS